MGLARAGTASAKPASTLASATVGWPLNFSVKCLYFHFEFAEGQNTISQSTYQIHFRLNKVNIGCVDADFNGEGGIFRMFQALSENKWNMTENRKKRKKPSHQNLESLGKFWKFLMYVGTLTFLSAFWNFGIVLKYFATSL